MHIGFITPEYPTEQSPEGGLGNYIQKVGDALVERGHRVTIFILTAQTGDKFDGEKELFYVRPFKFHWRMRSNYKLDKWLALIEQYRNAQIIGRQVLKFHKRNPLHIVQTSNYKTLGLGLIHNGQFPLVCRCSSYSPLLRSANGLRRRLPEAIADWLEAWQVSEADSAFSPSEFIANTYKNFESTNLYVIRTPIGFKTMNMDTSVYQSIAEGKKYLLFFGALSGVKGADILIQAAPKILSQYRELHIIFIGRNDKLPNGNVALDEIQSSLKQYWDHGKVIYHPTLAKPRLYPIIQNTVGVVLPSRVDNYPNACLEALALGVPVIGTYQSSFEEMIIDGLTGFLARNDDVDSLQNAIERLVNLSVDQRNQIVKNIKGQISCINAEDRIGQLINFYSNTIMAYKQI